jgi:signal transduction histidine kinase
VSAVLDLIVILMTTLCAVWALWRNHRSQRLVENRLSEMEQKAKQISERLRERGALANDLAHEIKNPITAILCSAEALDHLIGPGLNKSQRKCLTYIKEYGDTLLRLVTDFIDLSRLESGQISFEPERLELNSTLSSMVTLLQTTAQRRHVMLAFEQSSEELFALTDPKHLKQVLHSVIHLGLRLVPARSAISVRAARTEKRRLSIGIRYGDFNLPPEIFSKVLDPYRSLRQTPPAERRSLGMSLAVCKARLELQAGDLLVYDLPEGGTRVDLILSEAPLEASLPDGVLPGDGDRPLAGQKVLLLNEEKEARDALACLIEAWGGVVEQVSEAAEAVKALEREDYSAVMLDGDLESQVLIPLLKHKLTGKETSLLVATADEKDKAEALRCGADICLEKPLRGECLIEPLKRSGKHQS